MSRQPRKERVRSIVGAYQAASWSYAHPKSRTVVVEVRDTAGRYVTTVQVVVRRDG